MTKKRKKISYLAAFLTPVLLYTLFNSDEINFKIKKTLIDKFDNFAIESLKDEIEIHSGHYLLEDGNMVDPAGNHFCVFDGGKEVSIRERITNYCVKYLDGNEELTEKALEKFVLLMDNSKKQAKKIDLEEVYDENKIKVKK